jgi:hypothetical protein
LAQPIQTRLQILFFQQSPLRLAAKAALQVSKGRAAGQIPAQAGQAAAAQFITFGLEALTNTIQTAALLELAAKALLAVADTVPITKLLLITTPVVVVVQQKLEILMEILMAAMEVRRL